MRVLLSAGMIQGGLSGVGRYVVSLAENIRKNHSSLDLHVAGSNSDRKLFPEIADENWLAIPDWAARGAMNLLWHQACLPGHLKKRRIDLVHIPSYRRMIAFSPCKQVATIHDCAPFVEQDKYGLLRGFFGRKVVPWLAGRMDWILTVSETSRRHIVRYLRADEKRVQAVFNGVNHGKFHPRSEEELREFRNRKNLDQPYFCYVSRLEHPAKNHVRLIRAFECVGSAHDFAGELVLPGAPWHGSDAIERAVAESGAKERIRLEGFVGDEDLPLWYAGAEALIFPSLFEGFGLPLVEAQACGCLVACSNASSLPEVAGPAALMFDPESESAIAESMEAILAMDGEEKSRRRKEGIAWASRFDWGSNAEATVKAYEKVLGIER